MAEPVVQARVYFKVCRELETHRRLLTQAHELVSRLRDENARQAEKLKIYEALHGPIHRLEIGPAEAVALTEGLERESAAVDKDRRPS